MEQSIDCSELARLNVKAAAIYRERVALPPEAVLEATLEDISRADVRAELLGSVRIENPGLPPFHVDSPGIVTHASAMILVICARPTRHSQRSTDIRNHFSWRLLRGCCCGRS
ncbi:MAG: YbaY family lipoprotein [Gammaproteobacteria bacterium]